MLTVTKVTATKHLVRYRLQSDGSGFDTITLPNEQLLADMAEGSLRKLFDVKGLTPEQAVHRCQESSRVGANIVATMVSGPAPAFAVEIGVDGKGAPILTIGSLDLDTPYTGLLDLFYRPKDTR